MTYIDQAEARLKELMELAKRTEQAEARALDNLNSANFYREDSSKWMRRAEAAEAALKRALGEAQYWESRCRREADEALTLGAECDSLRLALAAVPVRAIRRIIEMHDAHAWSSVESPPLYAAVRAWLEVQP